MPRKYPAKLHTDRYKRASKLATDGMTYKDIGTELNVHPRTVAEWFKSGKCKATRHLPPPEPLKLTPLIVDDQKIRDKVEAVTERGTFASLAVAEYKALWFALNQQGKDLLESGQLTDFKAIKECISTQMALGKYIEDSEAARPVGSTMDEMTQMEELQKRRHAADKIYQKTIQQTG